MNKKYSALLIVCAAVTLLCVLLLCTNFFGLRGEGKAAPDPTAAPTAASSHYGESAEYHAARDWLDFTSAYDPDGSILQSAVAEGGTDYNGKCFLSHSACEEDAKAVAALVEERFPNLDGRVLINSIGTTIGRHTGPGTVALFFWGKKRED